MNIGNITSDNFNLDGNGKDIQIEVYEQLIEQLQQENQQLKEGYKNIINRYKFILNRINQGMSIENKNKFLIELGNNILQELENIFNNKKIKW